MKNNFKNLFALVVGVFILPLLIASCGDDDTIEEENVEEVITDVTLSFTPSGGGAAVTATFVDADGDGVMQPIISDLNLAANTTYSMSIQLLNSIENENISDEVQEEDDEHQFFFSWTNDRFSDPAGNGNTDNASDPVNYEDMDENNLPLGLSTSWTTGDAGTGTFRVVLKHQPDLKSATTTVNDGETDVDVTWTLNIL